MTTEPAPTVSPGGGAASPTPPPRWPAQAVCPGPDCWMCSGEACLLCGAGLRSNAPRCEHDVTERHTDPTPPLDGGANTESDDGNHDDGRGGDVRGRGGGVELSPAKPREHQGTMRSQRDGNGVQDMGVPRTPERAVLPQVREEGGAAREAPLTLTSPEHKPAKRSRKPRGAAGHWPPTPEAERVLRRILDALSDAREAAGWPAARVRPFSPLRRDAHGGLALRLVELIEDGEPDPEALLVAAMRAKVSEQRGKDGAHGNGTYATALSICRGAWWETNLAAGRAWLAREKPRAALVAGEKTIDGQPLSSEESKVYQHWSYLGPRRAENEVRRHRAHGGAA